MSGFQQAHGLKIESVRGRGFDSVRDLWLRTRLPPTALERLAEADAFRSLGLPRRDALWAVRALERAGDKDNLLFRAGENARTRTRRDEARMIRRKNPCSARKCAQLPVHLLRHCA